MYKASDRYVDDEVEKVVQSTKIVALTLVCTNQSLLSSFSLYEQRESGC